MVSYAKVFGVSEISNRQFVALFELTPWPSPWSNLEKFLGIRLVHGLCGGLDLPQPSL